MLNAELIHQLIPTFDQFAVPMCQSTNMDVPEQSLIRCIIKHKKRNATKNPDFARPGCRDFVMWM
jgi:hypothetical protein